jgi:hypothetical protein
LNYPTQHPQLEGLQADQHVFGDTDSLAQTYVLASPAPNGRVSLEAGQVFGVTMGSVFEIFAPGTKKFDGQSLARVQVTEVTPFASSARIVSGSAVQNFSRAIEREHNYGGLQLLLYFDPGSDSAQVRSLKTAVSAYKHVQVVADPNLAHLLIKRDGNSIVTLGADQTPYSPPLALNDPELASRFKNQIEQWARWFNVLSIRNLNPAINATVQIKTKKDGATKDPFARVDSSGPTVFVDETVEVTVTNKSSKDLYFALLDLQTDGSITTIYPPRGSHQVLTAQSSFTKSFTTFLPDQKKEVIDVVMLLASVRQFDAEVVAGPAVKDAAIPSDPIGRLLAFARGLRPDEPGQRPNSPTPPVTAGASTGVTAGASTGPLAVDQWVTDQKVLKVRAR